jgi:flavin reductase (DIM6/NTAB) family NADH-FMN oxidoreductase RutF
MKTSIGRKTVVYPHPVFVVSTYNDKGRPNMMTCSWAGICSSDPPAIAVSIRKSRYTYKNLAVNDSFSVNIPSVKHWRTADFAGIYSGKEDDKFQETGLTAANYDLINVPYIEEYPVNLICKVIQKVELGSHTQFIGEILDVLVNEDVLAHNRLPDINKIQPLLYDSIAKSYYSVGDFIANAFSTDLDDISKERPKDAEANA